ncbi:poly-beta-1,6-N-acetyl-D-glucosamine biosynthesis protein PgaD [Acinetobacter suaedae]|uniref:Poly-beta-1,6-N-acetyl-D-glucosamine biosynthesis protein PgaD n=1 Tax=Acinetobacter suaedae TaxID=2609668 RepID=A0A5P1UUB7_9GAMM|nr:poly-beta-1,6-N-acetyl-D-glucosamine biosynthesis protein PgaD [Acinetobacter sp. C16S1]QER39197.1 poly-beta-1,6-N-acetyl-D-glucosamine biosynthesis protein PgaD [Acinetobacter sp. C16S1]
MNQQFIRTIVTNIEHDVSKLDIPKYIDKPEYVTNRKAGYSLQMIGWLLWIWLLLPLFTIVLWMYEFWVVHQYVMIPPIIAQVYNLRFIVLGISLLVVTLLLWASYNWYRFKDNERRLKMENTPLEEFVHFFGVTLADQQKMQSAKTLILHYDVQGQLCDFDIIGSQKLVL